MTLFFLLLLISCSCNNPLDKKFADTNYIEILDELQQKNIITKEDRSEMEKRIMYILSSKYDSESILQESLIHFAYGVPFEKITYRDIYNRCCLEKK